MRIDPVDIDNANLIRVVDDAGEVPLSGTRAYGSVTRLAVGTTSTQSDAITGTEIMLHASVKCFVKVGTNPTAANDGGANQGFPLEAGEKFHLKINSGDKVAVIRDSADGFLYIAAVV